MFGIITVVTLLILFFLLTIHRFRTSPVRAKNDSASQVPYLPWLIGRIKAWFETLSAERIKAWYDEWIIQNYPPKQRWIYICLGLSFGYLILSGFFFALTGIRLQGVFLLLHVVLGGLFAVCLGLAVFFRARYYTWEPEDFEGRNGALNLQTGAARRKVWQIVLFWIFTASGLVLIVSALAQMLPDFSLRAQLVMFEAHRYAALESLLALIAFAYFSRVDDRR
jgi:hypothetical protein